MYNQIRVNVYVCNGKYIGFDYDREPICFQIETFFFGKVGLSDNRLSVYFLRLTFRIKVFSAGLNSFYAFSCDLLIHHP